MLVTAAGCDALISTRAAVKTRTTVVNPVGSGYSVGLVSSQPAAMASGIVTPLAMPAICHGTPLPEARVDEEAIEFNSPDGK